MRSRSETQAGSFGVAPEPAESHAHSRLALAAVAIVGLVTYARLYFGIDFTDESFYAAVPLRFVNGAVPLIDETNVSQLTPGLLLYPLIALYHWLVGLDALILFLRHVHFLFTVGVAVAVYSALRVTVRERAIGLLAGGMCVALVPFGIHALSYNTLGSGFFTAGCFLAFALSVEAGRRRAVLSGVFLGLAVFTYPPLAVPVACVFVAVYLAARPRAFRGLLPAVLPTAFFAAAAVAAFLHRGFGTIDSLVDRASTYGGQGGGVGDVFGVTRSLLEAFISPQLVLTLILAVLAIRASRPWLAVFPLLALPLAAMPGSLDTSASEAEFVTNLGLLAPVVLLMAPHKGIGKRLLAVVWLPAAVAGAVTALTSANGATNFAIGFFPGAIVATVLISLLVVDLLRTAPRIPSTVALVPGLVVLGLGLSLQYTYVYRDAGVLQLGSRTSSGAYAGLFTTTQRRAFLTELDEDLSSASGPACRIYFYDSFPGGYLLGHGESDTDSALTLEVPVERQPAYHRGVLEYFETRGSLPDVAVRIDELPLSDRAAIVRQHAASDPLERLFDGPRYRTAAEREGYRIFKRVGSTC